MQERQAKRRAERATKTLRGGLLMVLTGLGKGKSSSAFGMVARALGWEMRVGIVQFIKGKWQTGRAPLLPALSGPRDLRGDGRRLHLGCAGSAARHRRRRESSAARPRDDRRPHYDFVLLDEMNIALRKDYLTIDEVVAFLDKRPRDKHICITRARCEAGAGGRRPISSPRWSP